MNWPVASVLTVKVREWLPSFVAVRRPQMLQVGIPLLPGDIAPPLPCMIPTIVPRPDRGVAEDRGAEAHPAIKAAPRRASAVAPNVRQTWTIRLLVVTMSRLSSVVMVKPSEMRVDPKYHR